MTTSIAIFLIHFRRGRGAEGCWDSPGFPGSEDTPYQYDVDQEQSDEKHYGQYGICVGVIRILFMESQSYCTRTTMPDADADRREQDCDQDFAEDNTAICHG
ncbi:hypothetical protein LOK49_LG04G00695 [Camellia lanceoleosa]|uniref:Uncharacterized protein n=1 Tax=Camellia lanceoleosa TaxID=1840588 RepID=A0ACC0HYU6_9ERIC|nr:hypothetical protein LOK49_LG04G00695 [Camellia lanceoleosa]